MTELDKIENLSFINIENNKDEIIYDILLDNIYELFDKNVEFKNFTDKKITKPKVYYDSKIRRTIWQNFNDNLKNIDRNSIDLKTFIEKELLTTTSINQSNQLLIKGKYKPDLITNHFIKFVKYYVQCTSCKSLSTELIKNKEYKLYNVCCKKCFSEKPVKN
jgi:translation initiation factor 2 subunit 2